MVEQRARRLAAKLGISIERQPLAELIRRIQSAEGNFPCFGSAATTCDQIDCAWRMSCLGHEACATEPLTATTTHPRRRAATWRRPPDAVEYLRLSRKLMRLQDVGIAPASFDEVENETAGAELETAAP